MKSDNQLIELKREFLLAESTGSIDLQFSQSLNLDSTRWKLPKEAGARLGKGEIDEIAYSPDGTQLAVRSSIGIWLYDVHTSGEINLLAGHTDSVNAMAYSPDSQTLASGSSDKTIRLWDAVTGEHKQTLEGHTGEIRSIVYTPDGHTLASGSWSGEIRLWDAVTGEHKQTLKEH